YNPPASPINSPAPWDFSPAPTRCYIPSLPSKSSLPSSAIQSLCLDTLTNLPPNSIFIFTDGSLTPTHNGAAYVIPKLGIQQNFTLQDKCTIMELELLAIREALSWFSSSNHPHSFILTDSKSGLLALQKLPSSTSLHTLLSEIYSLYKTCISLNKSVKFQWIPSHIGLAGNEEADRLAKLPTGTPISLPPSALQTKKSLILSLNTDFTSYLQNHSANPWRPLSSITLSNKLLSHPPKKLTFPCAV
ncbi:uncharacterized protein LOC118196313, partial [Stegodyphus dumicola]|uniref:uncharacterized protein LOC118196313 n=1 Tax=Stegodyphus dumicola TaxID=202533 RepID=UPI0015ACA6FC